MSDKNQFQETTVKQTILLFGATGWIGSKIKQLMQKDFIIIDSKSRLEDFAAVTKEVTETQFDHCFLCAGITRDPKDASTNIDWCENNKETTIRINYDACVNLVNACNDRHIVYFGTGCIYEYDSEHLIGFKGYTETDEPNFLKSTYSYSKALFEEAVKDKNILILRFRMPVDSELSPRNIITKLLKYDKVINIPNSMSVLDDLLPLVPKMLDLRGIYNFVNPGVISHNQMLDLYKLYVDPSFTYRNFTVSEQSKVVIAPRSNTALDTSKLCSLFEVPDIYSAVTEVMIKIKNGLNRNGGLAE